MQRLRPRARNRFCTLVKHRVIARSGTEPTFTSWSFFRGSSMLQFSPPLLLCRVIYRLTLCASLLTCNRCWFKRFSQALIESTSVSFKFDAIIREHVSRLVSCQIGDTRLLGYVTSIIFCDRVKALSIVREKSPGTERPSSRIEWNRDLHETDVVSGQR